MILQDGTEINSNHIEELNANGPYSMAVWHSGEVSVGNEEGLVGRSEYLIKLIRKSILKNFTLEEIKTLSIIDIGCNDGWILHQLSDLPFSKMVGIEPRVKNIDKGKTVRKILKLENKVDYRIGDIESLQDKFDIVICVGVLHHVESIPVVLRKIRESSRRMTLIECRCLSSSHITEEIKDQIEMRDLVYQFKDEICGITAQKFESAYHDGSAAYNTIVNIPSTESLVMNLEILGFDEIEVVVDSDTYRKDVWQNKRPLGGVCISALVSEKEVTHEGSEENWIQDYEKGLQSEVLPRPFLEPLYQSFCLKNSDVKFSGNLETARNYLNSVNGQSSIVASDLPDGHQGKFALEIVKNWRYSPSDKIRLEFGKLLKQEERLDEALEVLKSVTTRLNADWRSVYRSFHLISEIYAQKNNTVEANRYKNFCMQSNPKYKTNV
jgi:ubiquinone/menaquinone biosynthesis C-methylase UbiE